MEKELVIAVDKLNEELVKATKRVTDIKTSINSLYSIFGEEPPYALDDDGDQIIKTSAIRSDQFFGKPFITSVREILEMKRTATSAEEILEALLLGGFEFTGDEKMQLRTVAITLGKNREAFCPVPGPNREKRFGLYDWYPSKKAEREKKKSNNENGAIVEVSHGAVDDSQNDQTSTELETPDHDDQA